MTNQPDVIVVGAGVMGCGTTYWLSKAGYTILVLEQEAIACGASGMAAAMLPVLLEESGVDTGYRENLVIHPAFTPGTS